ncbi:arabinose 5-phosphate isomerase KdsD [bacterium BMS3Abin09]|nr:arabinose 5-phosphate isomerase KdsD [bacterium BMS3Abin09]GBE41122.1 arabinose 5-phosphate isomerase KdsD [bacterium BMS3Bbin09]
MKEFIEQAKKILQIEAKAVSALVDRIDERFVDAIEIIYSCTGKIVVTGMGKSGLIGKKIAATFASTGTPAFFLNPAEGSHGDIGMVTKGDVVLMISNSGETAEIVTIIPTLKRMDMKIIAMTGNPNSLLARSADVSLDVSVEEEACPMGLAPTASTTAALAMGDALAITLLNKRGFTAEDFALIHPGGSLGRKLILTVSDIMHTGTDIPVVSTDTFMKDAIIEISSKRLGITAVVDSGKKLKGVLTDGDLRRGLEKWGEGLFSLKAEEVMTLNSKTVNTKILAAKALAIMEKHSITCLVVSDGGEKVDGVIHLHDLLKAGIV